MGCSLTKTQTASIAHESVKDVETFKGGKEVFTRDYGKGFFKGFKTYGEHLAMNETMPTNSRPLKGTPNSPAFSTSTNFSAASPPLTPQLLASP
jgi:hypothetical protein